MAQAARITYVCQSCGTSYPKWAGRCEACGAWNTLVEEQQSGPPGGLKSSRKAGRAQGPKLTFSSLATEIEAAPRLTTQDPEFDRVTGGGLVPGSALLIGGDPGIGKSTLLLQSLAQLSYSGQDTVYISGEESEAQVQLRAQRMGLGDAPLRLAASTDVRKIVTTLEREAPPAALVVDSIQTLYVDTIESAPGTVSQVRASAQELVRLAKKRGIALLLVGHVTKDGAIAGPKVVEHLVDAVLHFEGDRNHHFRILRALKNRFGPTDEIGVYAMDASGLQAVSNPSALFLSDHDSPTAGTVVFAGLEGTRPLLAEIQALVAPSPLATPRRALVGWDSGRLAMVLAVLEARCGLSLANRDVYLNVVGGLRILEPAADLAAAAAIASAATGQAFPQGTVIFGELGLTGELRAVPLPELRAKEADKLGFSRLIVPQAVRSKLDSQLSVEAIGHLSELVQALSPER